MRYKEEVTINFPLNKVVELFDNLEYRKLWQKGFVSSTLVEGNLNEIGAVSKLVVNMRDNNMELTETIIDKDLPYYIVTAYENSSAYNVSNDMFISNSDGTTKYTSDQEFKFLTLPMKIMGFLMVRMFKKETKANMEMFKNFAENFEEKP